MIGLTKYKKFLGGFRFMDKAKNEIEQYIYDYVAKNKLDEIDHWLTWTFEKNIDDELYIRASYYNAGGFKKNLLIRY